MTGAKDAPGYQRIGAALADFRFSKLAVVIGDEPDVHLEVRGQGKRIPQQIDLVLNVRGAREVANRLAFGPNARKP